MKTKLIIIAYTFMLVLTTRADFTANVTTYGAIAGDQSKATSNVQAIRSAVNALRTQTGVRTLYFPPGDYWIDPAFLITINFGSLIIRGDQGETTKLIRKAAFNNRCFEVNAGATRLYDITISDLIIDINVKDDGVMTQGSEADFTTGIYLNNCERVTVERCGFDNSGHRSVGHTYPAVSMNGVSQVAFSANWVRRCQTRFGGDLLTRDIHCSDNVFEDPHKYAISVVARLENAEVRNVRIERNIITGIAGDGGIYVGQDNDLARIGLVSGVTIAYNTVRGVWVPSPQAQGSSTGIFVRGALQTEGIQIEHNDISRSNDYPSQSCHGILVKASETVCFVSDAYVQYNTIDNMTQWPIALIGPFGTARVVGNEITNSREVRWAPQGGASGSLGFEKEARLFFLSNIIEKARGSMGLHFYPTSVRSIGTIHYNRIVNTGTANGVTDAGIVLHPGDATPSTIINASIQYSNGDTILQYNSSEQATQGCISDTRPNPTDSGPKTQDYAVRILGLASQYQVLKFRFNDLRGNIFAPLRNDAGVSFTDEKHVYTGNLPASPQ